MTICKWRHLGQDVRIFEPVVVLKPEQVSIGDYSRIDAFVKIEGGLSVTIGSHVHIASFSTLNAGGGELIFGSHSGCSCGVRITSGMPDISYLEISAAELPEDCHVIKRKTVIGEYVVIFSNAVICPGVTVGDGAIIGAGAVVTKDVPDWAIVAGVPAKVIGKRLLNSVVR